MRNTDGKQHTIYSKNINHKHIAVFSFKVKFFAVENIASHLSLRCDWSINRVKRLERQRSQSEQRIVDDVKKKKYTRLIVIIFGIYFRVGDSAWSLLYKNKKIIQDFILL